LGGRTLRCLDAISALSPIFRDWKFIDLFRDPDEMTEKNIDEFLYPLVEVRSRITEVVERGISDNGVGEPDSRVGYSISVSNYGVPKSQHVTLSAHGGGLPSWAGLPRNACFRTSYGADPDPAIVAYPMFKSILLAIMSSWDVDYAKAYSRDLSELSTDSRPFGRLSWMVYLSAPLVRRIEIPTDVLIERTRDGGLLMIAAEETFDVANPAHIAAARSIVAALEPLNIELTKNHAKFET